MAQQGRGMAEQRWYSCEECHAGQAPVSQYVGAECGNCGGKVVEVEPVAPNLSRVRDKSDPEAQRRRAEMEASRRAVEEEQG